MVVFFPTAAMVVYFAEIFQRMSGAQDQVLGGEIMQIHSRLSQDQRTRVSARFRGARNAILFTTDVSARGVDYPGVSLVVQVGAPKCREDYIHRIGRTGRGKGERMGGGGGRGCRV